MWSLSRFKEMLVALCVLSVAIRYRTGDVLTPPFLVKVSLLRFSFSVLWSKMIWES